MELSLSEKIALKYHDIFDYPLTKEELKSWKVNVKNLNIKGLNLTKISKLRVKAKDIYYFLKGRKEIVKKRLEKEKYSKPKLEIAQKASNLLEKIPTVKFVGITGALAMNNAGKESDIDLMIITSANRLWTTRLLVYALLFICGYKLRKPKDKNEKNKFCINMWLDEVSLVWNKKDRNIYTAHEIIQIVPLINKKRIYELLLRQNRWVLDFWPNAIQLSRLKMKPSNLANREKAYEKIAFVLQLFYMRSKITREVVTKNKALFHPSSWGDIVTTKLSS